MKKFFTKLIVMIVCVVLAISLMAVGVFADSRSSNYQRPDRWGNAGVGQRGMMTRGENKQGNGYTWTDGRRGRRNRFAFQALDAKTIEELIADLDDHNLQADLTELLKAYEDALAAEKTGMSNTTLTVEEKRTLNAAVVTAAGELIDALTDAGIQQKDYIYRAKNNNGTSAAALLEQPGDASSLADSEADSTDETGILQSFSNWLGSWIK